MTNNISTNVIQFINKFIEAKFGLYFHEKRFNDLVRGIYNASKQKNIDFEAYISLILLNQLNQEDLKNLVDCLTIGETYFFRDKKLFEIMRQRILPDIIHDRKYTSRSLKIWSAGCSSGEEAYSIAILMKELIPDYETWDIKIIATDINDSFLSKAKKGIYSEWSFRGVDLNIKNKYFNRTEDKNYKLKDDIAELVKFHRLNLADPAYIVENQIINNMDIIFCRNVLMYFSSDQVRKIIHRFYNILVNGGWLIVAPTESLFLNNTSFIPVNMNDMFLYNKNVKQNNLVKSFVKNTTKKNSFIQNEMITDCMSLDIHKEIIIKSLVTPVVEEMNMQKEVLQENKVDAVEFETLSRSLANEGKLEEAIEWCNKAIAIDKINPLYYHLLANIQQEQENISEAIASLKKAIYLDSDFVMAYFDLGNLNLKQKRYNEAYKNFENVLALLNHFNEEDILPHSEEMTVGSLKQIIENLCYEGDIYGEM